MSNRQIKVGVLLVLLLLLAFPARYFILGRARPVYLPKDVLAYQVGKGLQTSESSYRPLEGHDYTISDKKFFNGGAWAVVSVKPVTESLNPESMVFEKDSGNYKLVYGPSNFFQGGSFNSLPSEIKSYLINKR